MESPSITKITWVTRATIYSKLLSLNLEAQVRVRLELIHQSTKQEDSNTTQTVKYRKPAYQKKAGETPHTLHERSQQNNPERNKCTEMMLQKLLPEDFGKAEEGTSNQQKLKRPSKKQRERLQQNEQAEASSETTTQPEKNPVLL